MIALLCARSRCRKPAKRYTATIPVDVPGDAGRDFYFNGQLAQIAGGGGMHVAVDFCDRHARRCRWRLEPPPLGAP